MQRGSIYYGDMGEMDKLAVLTITLDTMDELLFEMLGDGDAVRPHAKVESFLNRETSIVGSTMQKLVRLLDGGFETLTPPSHHLATLVGK